jgi:hypothetical protein
LFVVATFSCIISLPKETVKKLFLVVLVLGCSVYSLLQTPYFKKFAQQAVSGLKKAFRPPSELKELEPSPSEQDKTMQDVSSANLTTKEANENTDPIFAEPPLGIYVTKTRITLKTQNGVSSIAAGTAVKKVGEKGADFIVEDGATRLTTSPEFLTRDPKVILKILKGEVTPPR